MSALRRPLPRPARQNTSVIHMRVPPALKLRVAERAVEYNMNMTQMTRALWEKEISLKHGILQAKLK